MKNQIFTIFCLCVLGAGFFVIRNSPEEPVRTEQTAVPEQSVRSKPKRPVLKGFYDINYSIKTLPTSVINYLSTSSEYKSVYNAEKKFVVYYVGSSCPYTQSFNRVVNSLKNNYVISSKYNFYPEMLNQRKYFNSTEEAQQESDFHDLCQAFCIVNPQSGEIFALEARGNKEADKLPEVFSQLKDW